MNNSEDNTIKTLVEQLCSDTGLQRKKAREALVAKGKASIPFLVGLLDHPKHIHRWEAIKTMDEIEAPETMPYLLMALNDDKSDVRWIAAKGLIKLGMPAVKPLLEMVSKNVDSVFILDSAHHIIYDLRESGELPVSFPATELLDLLKRPGEGGRIKVLLFKINSELA